ncbi:MAG TPA: pyridine nucleotide-disulfide oxidoreductase, partial [Rhodospirillales bacterium]|nr:pyridine nucleotide-disulfide oxidoreductase [Rhodospirillales bacterium]
MTDLKLSNDLVFEDLYAEDGLARIDALFTKKLGAVDGDLSVRLTTARANPGSLDNKAESDLILELAPHLEDFLGGLFGVKDELKALNKSHKDLNDLYACKRLFVQRRAAKAHKPDDAEGFNGPALEADLTVRFGGTFDQIVFAKTVNAWLEDEEANAESLDLASHYAAWALHTHDGHERHFDDILFRKPEKIDIDHFVPHETFADHGVEMMRMDSENCRHYDRDAFALTDQGTDLIGALDEINYCVICHDRARDYCSRGMTDKDTGKFTKNPLGVTQNGCPLEEKISEMHKAKMDGDSIASLAIIAIDNPVVAATGHRICNDCMKACIYQKQDPVNIPQAETRVLKDVLNLPWGFEIYSLLTRWNPLNIERPVSKPDSGRKVLIVGAGPAGYSLAHFLMNEGHTTVVIDGLKIEPLEPEICGVDQSGGRHPFKPIKDIGELWEPLDARIQAGFGGVSEYGITVRWDKNFLKVVRLLMERRKRFAMYGGVRFGSAITTESAFELGFDHVALAMGAGKPTFLSVPNGLARGVRQASDLLMALQLTGAAMKNSIANLQIRLPSVIIGGGLTAIDSATEVLAYYVRQVEKFLERYDVLVGLHGPDAVRSVWSGEEKIIADEFITHGRAIKEERESAVKEGRGPHFITLLDSWGGATIAYRRRMTGSPSYRLNHEEIEKAFEQGIRFAELLSPTEILVDEYNHCKAVVLEKQ